MEEKIDDGERIGTSRQSRRVKKQAAVTVSKTKNGKRVTEIHRLGHSHSHCAVEVPTD